MSSPGLPPSAAEQHLAALGARADLDGKRVLDIGCGGGDMMRLLTARGADAWGLEVSQAPLDRAVAAGIDPDRLVLGDGRSLPFEDAGFDLAMFVYSFHHVPDGVRKDMLAEVARILKPPGRLIAFEPRPYGELTETILPVEDETDVRTAAQALLSDPPPPFRLDEMTDYDTLRGYGSLEHLLETICNVDPARAERLEQPGIREDVASRFARLARPAGDGFSLLQPSALFILSPVMR